MFTRVFELYSSETHDNRRVNAESSREALTKLGLDPDDVYVERASGNKAILKHGDERYVLTDLGYA